MLEDGVDAFAGDWRDSGDGAAGGAGEVDVWSGGPVAEEGELVGDATIGEFVAEVDECADAFDVVFEAA
jgi:hypothetical protein